MGFLSSIVARLTGGDASQAGTSASNEIASELKITIEISGPGSEVPVSADEIATVVAEYAFVLDNQLPKPKASALWFDESVQKRRLKEGSVKASDWLAPFLPKDLDIPPGLAEFHALGPRHASDIAKFFRAQVRELKKAKQDYGSQLQALYGAAAMGALVEGMKFCEMPGYYGTPVFSYLSLDDLAGLELDYQRLGYQKMPALGKTDIKWLVERFGEPAGHCTLDEVYPHLTHKAVSRYCWTQLEEQNQPRTSLGMPPLDMQGWLNEHSKMCLGFSKEAQARMDGYQARQEAMAVNYTTSLEALEGEFAIVDIETTGLDANNDEIIEIGAILVGPGFSPVAEFSTLVKSSRPLPAHISQLTGIKQVHLDSQGVELREALVRFVDFVAARPLFAHHSPFDQGFLSRAAKNCGLQFDNSFHDTLSLARNAWPGLGSYKLSALAAHVGATDVPSHRALSDVKATLAVLRAAGEVFSDPGADDSSRAPKPKLEAPTVARVGHEQGRLSGEVVVFTGELSLAREQAAELAAQSGCAVGAGITKKTTMLVVGTQDLSLLAGQEKSSKHRKAEGLIANGQAIRILTESDFLALVNNT